jgi:hypothetical protein
MSLTDAWSIFGKLDGVYLKDGRRLDHLSDMPNTEERIELYNSDGEAVGWVEGSGSCIHWHQYREEAERARRRRRGLHEPPSRFSGGLDGRRFDLQADVRGAEGDPLRPSERRFCEFAVCLLCFKKPEEQQ